MSADELPPGPGPFPLFAQLETRIALRAILVEVGSPPRSRASGGARSR